MSGKIYSKPVAFAVMVTVTVLVGTVGDDGLPAASAPTCT